MTGEFPFMSEKNSLAIAIIAANWPTQNINIHLTIADFVVAKSFLVANSFISKCIKFSSNKQLQKLAKFLKLRKFDRL